MPLSPSHQHHACTLTRDEILLASGDAAEEATIALDRLIARHLVVAHPPDIRYRTRHRVIADLVVDRLSEMEQLQDVLAGLAFAAGSKVDRGRRLSTVRGGC